MIAAVRESIGLINPLLPPQGTPIADVVSRAEWGRVVDELLRLRDLGPDWDGQGADAPSEENIDAALHWVGQMQPWGQAIPPAKVAPGVAGEIHLVWQQGAFVLDAEIAQPSAVTWLLSLPGEPVRQWTTDLTDTWLVGLLEDR